MSYSVRERERERDWETSSRYSESKPRSVTVRRYKVPDRDGSDDRGFSETVRVSRPSERGDRRDYREFRYEDDVIEERPRYERNVERMPSPGDDYREWRIERQTSNDSPRRDSRELEKYSRVTDYYGREPQPIYIRNEAPQPIIIREPAQREIIYRDRSPPSPAPVEPPRSEHSEVKSEVQSEIKSEVKSEVESETKSEEKSLVKRDEPGPPAEVEDDYYYQRTTREVRRRGREREPEREPEIEERYDTRDWDVEDRSVKGDRRSRNDDYSEDETWYRKTEEWIEGEDDGMPHHKRHLAEGLVAGAGAAALLGHHRKSEGKKSGGITSVLGGAALGALGSEGLQRARSHRSKSRRRSSDEGEREGGRRRDRGEEERSRSRSGSHSRLKKLGGIAALGALAGYALSKVNKDKDQDDRRSRSRHRRGSRSRHRSRSESESGSDGGKSIVSQKNKVIAGAGLASAAVAGLVDRARNKGMLGGEEKKRSTSKTRKAIPIGAAGLAGAALAGLWENNKAKKREEERDIGESRSRSRSRDRSESRDRSASRDRSRGRSDRHSDSGREAYSSDQGLIEYGGGPISPDEQDERARDNYFEDGRRSSYEHEANSPSRRLRSQSRHDGEDMMPGGAGVAGIAAAEASRRRAAARESEQEQARDATYGWGPYAQEQAAYAPPPQQYAAGGSFGPQDHNPYAPPPQNFGQGGYQNASPYGQPMNGPPPSNGHPGYTYQPPPGAEGYGPPGHN